MSDGMSAERLKRLDTFVSENYIDAGRIPGALTLVARRGEIVHCSTQGMMDAERRKSTAEDTIYRIYSMTKPITSVGLMMLYEEGRFQLNDPVHEYLPEWKDVEVWVSGDSPPFETRPAERHMTIRDLLSHQSGLSYGFTSDHPVDRAYGSPPPMNAELESLSTWSKSMAQLPLFYSPGSAWRYSIATDLCGYLTEIVSGQPFDAYLEERITGPLGMTDTVFSVSDDKLDRFAACYEPDGNGGYRLQDDPETSKYRSVPKIPSGGGGMVSTAGDYYRFCQMLMNGGELDGVRILGPKTLALMTSNHLPGGASLLERGFPGSFNEAPYDGLGFGLGFSVLMDPAHYQVAGSAGIYGWGGAASTAFWVDPVEELIFVFMTQLLPSNTYPIRRELQAMVYAAIEG